MSVKNISAFVSTTAWNASQKIKAAPAEVVRMLSAAKSGITNGVLATKSLVGSFVVSLKNRVTSTPATVSSFVKTTFATIGNFFSKLFSKKTPTAPTANPTPAQVAPKSVQKGLLAIEGKPPLLAIEWPTDQVSKKPIAVKSANVSLPTITAKYTAEWHAEVDKQRSLAIEGKAPLLAIEWPANQVSKKPIAVKPANVSLPTIVAKYTDTWHAKANKQVGSSAIDSKNIIDGPRTRRQHHKA